MRFRLEDIESVGRRRAEWSGVEFLGARILPLEACFEQRFVARAPAYLDDQHATVRVTQEEDWRRSLDVAGERLQEWTESAPVLAIRIPMAVGL